MYSKAVSLWNWFRILNDGVERVGVTVVRRIRVSRYVTHGFVARPLCGSQTPALMTIDVILVYLTRFLAGKTSLTNLLINVG